ncbi:unnamed protein product [Durusdinium trenchii]
MEETHQDLIPTTGGTYANLGTVEVSPGSTPRFQQVGKLDTPLATPGTIGTQQYTPHASDLTPFEYSVASTISPLYSPANKKEEDDKDMDEFDYSPGASVYSRSAPKTGQSMASGRYTPAKTPGSVYAPKTAMYTPSAMSPFSHKSPGYTPMSSQYGAGTPTSRFGATPGPGGYSPSIAPASLAPSGMSEEGASPIIQEHAGPDIALFGAESPSYTPQDGEGPAAPAPSAVFSAVSDVRAEDVAFDEEMDFPADADE